MLFLLAIGTLSLMTYVNAGEFHYGAAFGIPFNVSTDCTDINMISPELLINWGPDNRDDNTMNVCGNNNIKFVPYLWGQGFDDPELSQLPSQTVPWGVILENEPNWWGFEPLTADHGSGCNLTATEVARRYHGHTNLINQKWGVGVVKLIAPSPITTLYQACDHEPESGCYYQNQMDWLDEFFANCNGCFNDIWALNLHEYSCNLDRTKGFIQALLDKYGTKNIFLGELGCDGPSEQDQAQYLTSFVEWAYVQRNVVGFLWTGVNFVGAQNSQLVNNGQLTAVGQAFKNIQANYPPRYTW